MRSVIVTYLAGLVAMVVLDFGWLSLATGRLYRPGIGHLMADKPALWAGALFYLVFVAGLSYLVTVPGLPLGLGYAARRGAVFGLVAYATYDLTAQAVLRGWPVTITVIDIVWGGILTMVTAVVAVSIGRL